MRVILWCESESAFSRRVSDCGLGKCVTCFVAFAGTCHIVSYMEGACDTGCKRSHLRMVKCNMREIFGIGRVSDWLYTCTGTLRLSVSMSR